MNEQLMRMEKRETEKKESIVEEKVEKIDLSGMSLSSLPNQPHLTMISTLDLSNNNIKIIPESVAARLLNVEVLDLHSNQLKSLPNSISCVSKLKFLNVSGNLLSSLPKTIENCRSLEELNANFNQLTRLPDTIGFELENLKKLSVNSNKLAFLPYSICQLTNLRILDARLNCLRSLPEGLENLISLQVLNVSQNFQYLDTLPYSIGLLLSLIELDISYNKITVLPESMGCLKNLQKLCVAGNPIVSPPMEIVEQSLTAVKEYLSEKMNGNPNSPTKKASWLRKLKKYGTFNATMSNGPREEREGFIITDYHKLDAVTSPRHFNRLWPQRLLSYRNSFKK